MIGLLIAASVASTDLTLWKDLKLGESVESIQQRHQVKKQLGSYFLRGEDPQITPSCGADVQLNVSWKAKTLNSVTLRGHCGADALSVLTAKYGAPLVTVPTVQGAAFANLYQGKARQIFSWTSGNVKMVLARSTNQYSDEFELTYSALVVENSAL